MGGQRDPEYETLASEPRDPGYESVTQRERVNSIDPGYEVPLSYKMTSLWHNFPRLFHKRGVSLDMHHCWILVVQTQVTRRSLAGVKRDELAAMAHAPSPLTTMNLSTPKNPAMRLSKRAGGRTTEASNLATKCYPTFEGMVWRCSTAG